MKYSRKDEIEEQAKNFHYEHPEVWKLFVRFSGEIIDKNFKHYSSKSVFERIRWETDQADIDGKSTFKINNNYTPYYARWFMNAYPQYDGFFRVRELISKEDNPAVKPELGPDDFPYV